MKTGSAQVWYQNLRKSRANPAGLIKQLQEGRTMLDTTAQHTAAVLLLTTMV
jgi:hypothetical protein